jgi:hypothetical protein
LLLEKMNYFLFRLKKFSFLVGTGHKTLIIKKYNYEKIKLIFGFVFLLAIAISCTVDGIDGETSMLDSVTAVKSLPFIISRRTIRDQ